jgi:hypothetical protein
MRLALFSFVLAGCPSSGSEGDRRVDAGADADSDADECLGVEPTPAGPCGCGLDCDDAELCASEVEAGLPSGWCLRPCDADRPCPDGTFCDELEVGSGEGVCERTCETTADCRTGYVCTHALTDPNPLICWPFCQADSDCPTTGSCDPWQGTCGDALPQPGDLEIGDPCTADVECRTGVCSQGTEWPGGYCSSGCSVTRQGCPPGSVCVGAVGSDDDFGTCYESCDSHADCREAEGYVCVYREPDYGTSWCTIN